MEAVLATARSDLQQFLRTLKTQVTCLMSQNYIEGLEVHKVQVESLEVINCATSFKIAGTLPSRLESADVRYHEVWAMEKALPVDQASGASSVVRYFARVSAPGPLLALDGVRSAGDRRNQLTCTLSWFRGWPEARRYLLFEQMSSVAEIRDAMFALRRNCIGTHFSTLADGVLDAVRAIDRVIETASATESKLIDNATGQPFTTKDFEP